MENNTSIIGRLPVPTQDRHMLFTLLRLDLERNTFSAPIKKLTIEAVPVKPRMAQGNLFAPPSPETEKLEITLARIRGVVGSNDAEGISCVGSPQILDTHKPVAFAVQSFSGAVETWSPSAVVPTLALRVFRPALETSVELTGETPHFVRLWKKHRRVLAASGPVVQLWQLVERNHGLGPGRVGCCSQDISKELATTGFIWIESGSSGLWKASLINRSCNTSNYTPVQLLLFLKAHPCLSPLSLAARNRMCLPWLSSTGTVFTGRHVFTWRQSDAESKRTSVRRSALRKVETIRCWSSLAPGIRTSAA